jgi:hypothetical protein
METPKLEKANAIVDLVLKVLNAVVPLFRRKRTRKTQEAQEGTPEAL